MRLQASSVRREGVGGLQYIPVSMAVQRPEVRHASPRSCEHLLSNDFTFR